MDGRFDDIESAKRAPPTFPDTTSGRIAQLEETQKDDVVFAMTNMNIEQEERPEGDDVNVIDVYDEKNFFTKPSISREFVIECSKRIVPKIEEPLKSVSFTMLYATRVDGHPRTFQTHCYLLRNSLKARSRRLASLFKIPNR